MMHRNRIQFFAISVLAYFLSAVGTLSMAAEYYVSTTGDDNTGTGLIGSPYRTVQHVLDNVVASGDIITLRGGTYSENIRIRNSNITIRSKSDEWAAIESVVNDEEKGVAVIFDVDSDGSTLQRIEVIGGFYYGIKFNTKWEWGDPNDRSGACNITIEDCRIHDTGDACIKITPGCDDIIIRRCEIYRSGRNDPESAEAIDNVNGDRMLVQQCTIHDIPATGLYAKGGGTGTVIEGCLIENCGFAGVLLGFDTSLEWFDTQVNPDYYENIDGTVRNCIVRNTQYSGIGLYAAKNAAVYNNTLVNVAQNGHSGLYFGLTFQDWEPEAGRPPSVNPVIRNNIVVQSGSANSTMMEIRYEDELGGLSGLSGMPTMSHNRYFVENGTARFEDNRPGSQFEGDLVQWQSHISGDVGTTEGDPEFVAPATGDYHLSATSPCIDTGTSNGAPNTDYDGITRPQGQGYDVGAYEYVSAGTPIPDIRVNDSNGPISVSSGTPMSINVSLNPGNYANQNADWWVAQNASGGWHYYDVLGGSWMFLSGLSVTYQGPLFSVASLEILNTSALPAGTYTFYFGVDMNKNGSLDFDSLYYDMVQVHITSGAGHGHISYSLWDGRVYRIRAEEGAIPEDISQALETISPLPPGGVDEHLNISPDGKWFVLETQRFGDDCDGCLAIVAGDLSTGEAIRSNGTVIYPEGFSAIASGGNLVIYPSDDGTHSMDLWAIGRSSGSAWGVPFELTTASTYAYNYWPSINQDGTKVLFDCTDEPFSGNTCICEVGTDGTGFRVVLTPADSPSGLPNTGELHSADYAPDGSIVFEADWEGEEIWRLPAGAIEPVKITNTFGNDNSPCVLPDGRIASLWLNRPGGSGDHELKVMASDGSSYFILLPNIDVADIGLGCGN